MAAITSSRTRLGSIVCVLALALSGSAGAAGFGKPGTSAQAGQGDPVVEHYTPLPASWNESITIHGRNLRAPNDPTAAVTDPKKSARTYLYWGNSQEVGLIPESAIQQWTSSEIRLRGLDAPEGVYAIILIRDGEIVSNFNKTLFLGEGRPRGNGPITIEEANRPGTLPVEVLVPLDPMDLPPTDVAEDFFLPGPNAIQRGPLPDDHPYTNLEIPDYDDLSAFVLSYEPAIASAEDEVTLSGFFPNAQQHMLVYGVGNDAVRSVKPAGIKSWSQNQVVLRPGAVPMGVWWIAVFTKAPEIEGIELVSNLNLGLQITSQPTPNQDGVVVLERDASERGSENPRATPARSRNAPNQIDLRPTTPKVDVQQKMKARGQGRAAPEARAKEATRTLQPDAERAVRKAKPTRGVRQPLEVEPAMEPDAADDAVREASPVHRVQPVR